MSEKPQTETPRFPDLQIRNGLSLTPISKTEGFSQLQAICLDLNQTEEGAWLHRQISGATEDSAWLNIRASYAPIEEGKFEGTVSIVDLEFKNIPGIEQKYTHCHIHNAYFLPENSDLPGIKNIATISTDEEISASPSLALQRDQLQLRKQNMLVAIAFYLPSIGDIEEYLKLLSIASQLKNVSFDFVIFTPFGRLTVEFDEGINSNEHHTIADSYSSLRESLYHKVLTESPELLDDRSKLGEKVIELVSSSPEVPFQIKLEKYSSN